MDCPSEISLDQYAKLHMSGRVFTNGSDALHTELIMRTAVRRLSLCEQSSFASAADAPSALSNK